MATATAHPNIALVKYWGKQDKPGNFPATPSLSITLDTLATETTVVKSDQDSFHLAGSQVKDAKVTKFLAGLRGHFDVPPLAIETQNNFPTGAGLASSASGFAALITAINEECGLGLEVELASEWARMGSASAARSMFGGYVSLVPPLWRAQPTAPASHWPLAVVVAITSTTSKAVSSGKGMEITRTTSPYYKTWLDGSGDDYARVNDAIASKDFAELAAAAELNCLKMHAIMQTSVPTLNYWNPATISVMEKVRQLRDNGKSVFFTIDAGPQVKVVCLPEQAQSVAQALAETSGVLETVICQLGPGAYLKP
ncbi:MAG: diphosphomevalonate decarboxylase [Limisphaerales bacterium]|jgi:diphosphomevalonate decarboxylase